MTAFQPSPIENELSTNEQLKWSGRPKQGFTLRSSDLFLIPFSILWAGFAVFWETGVINEGAPLFFKLWGVPFVLMGAYITIGRFFVDYYIRSKTFYGVTSQRAIIVSGLFTLSVKSLNLKSMSDISMDQKNDGSGNITFGSGIPYAAWYRGMAWPGIDKQLPPQFEMIPDVKVVYELIRQGQQG